MRHRKNTSQPKQCQEHGRLLSWHLHQKQICPPHLHNSDLQASTMFVIRSYQNYSPKGWVKSYQN